MKMIILAAGQGTRLRPLTDDRPKCMVEYKGKQIVDHILEAATACGITDIVLIKGYKEEVVQKPGVKNCINKKYDSTNMLSTLFCAEDEMVGDVIVSYADIVYTPEILRSLIDAKNEFSVVVDKRWRELWEARMEDPLKDAETMKINSKGQIIELGKKPSSLEDIQGQYIGLFKISASAIESVKAFYHSLDSSAKYDGKDFDNMYMTSFIQLVIDRLMPVHPVFIDGGWIEIDAPSDLNISPI
ncbi:MAG: phosphocholine cytidylyltransferase family protein [Bdellovibrionales bacterium]|nr:phosphocholine cytidylyltransferase family protein [Bdellovibrionales bacterium]